MAHPASIAGRQLRQLMRKGCVALPGAFCGGVGRAAAKAGFDGCYISGAAVTGASGHPDIGLLGLEDFTRVIRDVSTGSGLPVLADADTGFGETEMVTKTMIEYHRAGAAGFHIEDQVFPKRCGHLDGKSLVSAEYFQRKVVKAAEARDQYSDGTFIVCARTDAYSVNKGGVEAVIERAKLYVDAGADMIFPEGLTTEEEFIHVAESLKGYGKDNQNGTRLLAPCGGPFLLSNMTEFGKTPIIPLKRFEEMGYHCTIFPVSTFRSAMGAATRLLTALKRDGHVGAEIDEMMTRKDLYDVLGYSPSEEYNFPSNDYSQAGPRTNFQAYETKES